MSADRAAPISFIRRSIPPFVELYRISLPAHVRDRRAGAPVAAAIERSSIGMGLAAIRDDETAAAALGVPTLRLKVLAATTSGAIMGMAGAPLPFYSSYINPDSAFAIGYTVNAMAMPLVGGMETWLGPVLGAALLGSIQQLAVAFISSSASLALIGLVFMGFVALAPQGLDRSLSARCGQVRRASDGPPPARPGFGNASAVLWRSGRRLFSVAPGERVGLIGPNGSGKSTFVNCLAGAFARHDGVVAFAGHDCGGLAPHRRARLGLARTFQLPRPFASLTVLENVEVPLRFLDARAARRASVRAINSNASVSRQGSPAAARPHPGRFAPARSSRARSPAGQASHRR